MLPNLPDAFIRDKGIVVIPAKEVGFKERVKNDIVLVESVPEFKPTVVKRDYEEEERLREERERALRDEERLRREREIVERERELREREQQIEAEERLRRERDIAERERIIQERERELRQQPNRNVRRYKNDIDLSPLRNGGLIRTPQRRGHNGNDRSRGNFNFNLNFGK